MPRFVYSLTITFPVVAVCPAFAQRAPNAPPAAAGGDTANAQNHFGQPRTGSINTDNLSSLADFLNPKRNCWFYKDGSLEGMRSGPMGWITPGRQSEGVYLGSGDQAIPLTLDECR